MAAIDVNQMMQGNNDYPIMKFAEFLEFLGIDVPENKNPAEVFISEFRPKPQLHPSGEFSKCGAHSFIYNPNRVQGGGVTVSMGTLSASEDQLKANNALQSFEAYALSKGITVFKWADKKPQERTTEEIKQHTAWYETLKEWLMANYKSYGIQKNNTNEGYHIISLDTSVAFW